jgi:hypothetical protein
MPSLARQRDRDVFACFAARLIAAVKQKRPKRR